MHGSPVLHILCGKIASGKSTLARELAASEGAIVLAEDTWLAALFQDQMHGIADFVRCSGKLRQVVGPHVEDLLKAGLSVVLDYQANTVESRVWVRGLIERTGVAHVLHYLDVPDAVCLARMTARNASGDHPFAPSEDQFAQITRHFAPPGPEEGFEVVRHGYEV